MSSSLLGLPKNRSEQQKAFIVASVVIVIAVTPTALDQYRSWSERPETRLAIVGIDILAVVVALSAWRVFIGGN